MQECWLLTPISQTEVAIPDQYQYTDTDQCMRWTNLKETNSHNTKATYFSLA